MIKTIDSRLIPRSERVEAIAEQGRRDVIPVDIDYGGHEPLVLGSVIDLGAVRLSSYRTSAVQVGRTASRAEDDYPPSLMLALQVQGSSLVVQDGREVLMRPGDLCVERSDAPFMMVDDQGYRRDQVLVRTSSLGLPSGIIRQVTATRLCVGHPIADLAVAYFYRLLSRLDDLDTTAGELISQPSIELLRAVIATHLDAESALTRESSHQTLLLRILEYIRAHLRDPQLSAQQIAHEHHISVRHLYNLLADNEIRLGEWIRTRRLEAVRDDLSRPTARHTTIASVARQHGFVDPSSFGRLFRAEFGRSPGQWRDRTSPGSAG